MKNGKMEQSILVVCLDVICTLALHGIIEVAMEKLDSLVVCTASPSIEETALVSDVKDIWTCRMKHT
jgi:hypothetical protein